MSGKAEFVVAFMQSCVCICIVWVVLSYVVSGYLNLCSLLTFSLFISYLLHIHVFAFHYCPVLHYCIALC